MALPTTQMVSTVAEPTGAGNVAVQISPSGATTFDRRQRAFVPLHVPGERRQDGAGDAAHQAGARAVDEARRLLARAGEVERQLVAALRHLAVGLVEHVAVAVVLEEIDGVEFAVGQFAQARPHPGLGRCDHAADRLRHGVGAVARRRVR